MQTRVTLNSIDAGPRIQSGRLYYGWVIVAVSLLLLVGSLSVQLSFGLFLKPLSEQFGWSRAAVSGAISLLMAVSGLIAMLMGRATDRYGPRAAMLPGVIIGALSCALLSRIDSLWQFYLLYGVGGGLLAGCTYTPSVTAVSRWFDAQRRTSAIGLVLLGPIIGQMILSPVIARVINASGWRTAWIVFAPIIVVCGLPALVLVGRKPPAHETVAAAAEGQVGTAGQVRTPGRVRTAKRMRGDEPGTGPSRSGLSTREACKTFSFWILMLAGAVIGMGFTSWAAHVVPYATDRGVSSSAAALILTVGSAGGLAGSLLAGAFTARVGFKYALLGLTALNGVMLLLFIPAASVWAFYLLGAILGFAFNALNPVRVTVIPSLFGGKAMGSIVGLSVLSFCMGSVAGPFLAGYIFDSTGGYTVAFVIFGVLLAVGALFLNFLRIPDRANPDSPA
jgi:MFS family permease